MTLIKTFFFTILLGTLVLLSLANAAVNDAVKMQLSWVHQFQFAGYYAALEKGFYEEEGLEVTLLEGGPGISCNEHMLLHQAHYCNGLGSVLKRRIEGEAIVALASFIQHSPVVLITLKDAGLMTPRDLIGKRVETLVGGEPIAEIKAMFKHEGIALDQLDNQENSASIDTLIKGQVDAKYGFVTNEPYQLDSLGIDYHIISPRDYGIDFYGDALFTSESEIDKHPERVEKFLRASIKGWIYAMENKPEIILLILNKYSDDKTFDELMAEANAMENLMLKALIKIGHINEARWKITAETLLSKGLIDQGFSLDGFIYKAREKYDYSWLLKLLAFGLFVAVLVSLVLYWFNRAMSAEIKVRTEAQHFLSVTNQQIREQAYTDELSGMGNRRAFYEAADAEIKLACLDNTSLAALMIDIDHFKSINDQFGHAAGDLVIKQLATVILEIVRCNDVQGRIGGEEFAIITPNTPLEGAVDLADRLRLAVENIEVVSGQAVISVTVSIGVSEFKSGTDDLNAMLARADEALYEAKRLGRNQVVISQ
ncbi:MAG: diguanylate cyclase [Leucothrix sp.]